MSLIDRDLVCDDCGGYRVPYSTTLSSVCKCPGFTPATPGRHQIGAPQAPVFTMRALVRTPR
ncbi:MAG: hypothetical protein WKF79_00050 [Nocardioides sp.]